MCVLWEDLSCGACDQVHGATMVALVIFGASCHFLKAFGGQSGRRGAGTSERVLTLCRLSLLNPWNHFHWLGKKLPLLRAGPGVLAGGCTVWAAGFSLQPWSASAPPVPLSSLRTSPGTVNSLLR